MIKEEKDFYNRVQSCIAPIYFFNQSEEYEEGKKITHNGTITLYKEGFKVFGITNYHVYQSYLEREDNNSNAICQLGYQFIINLTERMICEDKKNDLFVFFLYEDELKKIGGPSNSKSGFKHINTNIENLLKDQSEDQNTWPIHIAGFPGVHKITKIINHKETQENFGIFLANMPAEYFPDPLDNNGGPKITLDFGETRKAIFDGYLKVDIGQLSGTPLILGGISGCPVFARIFPNQEDLTLLGIVSDGPSDSCSELLPENIYAKPVSLIEEILKGK